MKRRGNNEGSIYKRKDGRWAATLSLGYAGGKRRRKTLYGRTQREVQEKLRAAQRAQQDGLPVDHKRQTVRQFLSAWLAENVKPTRRTSTYASYESLVRVHILPSIGDISLTKLGPQHLQAMLNAKLAAGLSRRTVRYLYSIMHMALAQAERWGAVPRNVARLVDPPSQQSREVQPLEAEEARQFLEAVRGDRLAALWTVALAVGLRRGEALALRWEDIDFKRRTLSVRQSLQRIDGRLQSVSPKTPRSVRTIALPDALVEALQAHRTRQLEERLGAGPQWQDSGLVFTTAIGTPLDGRNVTRRLQRLLEEAGLPRQTFHALRHGCASLLLAQGVSPRVVMQTLGHTQSATTMEVYQHVSAALEREAADRMDAFLRTVR